jgi:hypothetical protein
MKFDAQVENCSFDILSVGCEICVPWCKTRVTPILVQFERPWDRKEWFIS